MSPLVGWRPSLAAQWRPTGAATSSIDGWHLLLVGAGPSLGRAVARRFAAGSYRATLMPRARTGSALGFNVAEPAEFSLYFCTQWWSTLRGPRLCVVAFAL